MTPQQFIAKWQRANLSERSAAQSHFLDLCKLLDEREPVEADPDGSFYTFERGVRKTGGGKGWADVWKKGYFGWEYKKKRRDLAEAYEQLLLYREELENPPLLVVCDLDRFEVHTNFTNTVKQVYAFALADLAEPANLDILRKVFANPEALRPGQTTADVTQEVARRFAKLADGMRDRNVAPDRAAHFLMKLMFCMFAEDIDLLPGRLFSKVLSGIRNDPKALARKLKGLFQAMASGGEFGADTILHFNGGLFADADVEELTPAEIEEVIHANECDWSNVEPSIFGTLFERTLDPAKRSQIGAHYTSKEDILTLLEPVMMAPLRAEWEAVRAKCEELWAKVQAARKKDIKVTKRRPTGPYYQESKGRKDHDKLLVEFAERLARVKVLDPACGSGNFLYVAINLLLDLEKRLISYGSMRDFSWVPHVRPSQLAGIEINPYAQQLAQVVIWIGYLQWMHHNGFKAPSDPVLEPIENIRRMDAILDLGDANAPGRAGGVSPPSEPSETGASLGGLTPPARPESDPTVSTQRKQVLSSTLARAACSPKEPEWPAADFIVGNPPFLGSKKLRDKLGDDYTNALLQVYTNRVQGTADLCVYWFEKARQMIADRRCKRVGLLATQTIRGTASRRTLARIKDSGDIFFAISDRDWILDGAAVHVSLVGFDNGEEQVKSLDGTRVQEVHINLKTGTDITTARQLPANADKAFMGDTKGGSFELGNTEAIRLLGCPNPHGKPNSDVIVPWANAADIAGESRDIWIVDFGLRATEEEASMYEAPFEFVRYHVYPERRENRREAYRERWWLHVEARPGMRKALAPLSRFFITTITLKYRLFSWMQAPTLPDHKLIAFAFEDDCSFGALESRIHRVWTHGDGSQVREKESGFTYIPTTNFMTFPFPTPTPQQEAAIAAAAKEMDTLRTTWLNPPEWTRQEVLEFPGSVSGPWARYVQEADKRGIGSVRYPRLVPKSAVCADMLKKRTLTNLYNERPTWLDLAHRKLDAAVFAAYGWKAAMSDEEILAKLLALNLERAGK